MTSVQNSTDTGLRRNPLEPLQATLTNVPGSALNDSQRGLSSLPATPTSNKLEEFLSDDCRSLLPKRKIAPKRAGGSDETHWSLGGMPSLSHRGKIDSGAWGDVHCVQNPAIHISNSSYTTKQPERSVASSLESLSRRTDYRSSPGSLFVFLVIRKNVKS
jgi:hypothetical protein